MVAERDESPFVPDLRRQVAGGDAPLLLGGLGEGRDGGTIVVHAGGVAHSVDPGPALHAQVLVDEDAPALVLLDVEPGDEGTRVYAGGPDDRARGYVAPAGEGDAVGADLRHLDAVDHLYPLGGEPALRGVGQGGVYAFQDAVPGVHEHEAHAVEVNVRVVALEDVEDQVVRIGRRLDPRRSPADEDEGQEVVWRLRPEALGLLEAVYDPVADPQGVAQALEVNRVLPGAGDVEVRRTASGGQDQVVVGEGAVSRLDLPGLEVHLRCLLLEELSPEGQDPAPDRVRYVADLDVPRDGRRHHRPEGG